MIYLIIGIGIGVYFGTYYECKPYLEKICEWSKNHLPVKK